MDIASGELVAVLGASGSGKTTLLRVVAGFLRPQAGDVLVDQRIVAGPHQWIPPERRGVGIVPQEGALFPHLDVFGNIAFGLRGSPKAQVMQRVEELLELVGLTGFAKRRPQELSGGQQQRVALARALAPQPSLICLDEPFAALDTALRTRLSADVRRILHTAGTTVLMVTHDQQEALSMADRVAVIRSGRIMQIDSPTHLYREPIDPEVARLVGEVVELPAQRTSVTRAITALGSVRVQRPTDLADHVGSGGMVMLRPEQLALSRRSAGDGCAGHIIAVSFHGAEVLIEVRLGSRSTPAADTEVVSLRLPMTAITELPQVGALVRVEATGTGRFYPGTPTSP